MSQRKSLNNGEDTAHSSSNAMENEGRGAFEEFLNVFNVSDSDSDEEEEVEEVRPKWTNAAEVLYGKRSSAPTIPLNDQYRKMSIIEAISSRRNALESNREHTKAQAIKDNRDLILRSINTNYFKYVSDLPSFITAMHYMCKELISHPQFDKLCDLGNEIYMIASASCAVFRIDEDMRKDKNEKFSPLNVHKEIYEKNEREEIESRMKEADRRAAIKRKIDLEKHSKYLKEKEEERRKQDEEDELYLKRYEKMHEVFLDMTSLRRLLDIGLTPDEAKERMENEEEENRLIDNMVIPICSSPPRSPVTIEDDIDINNINDNVDPYLVDEEIFDVNQLNPSISEHIYQLRDHQKIDDNYNKDVIMQEEVFGMEDIHNVNPVMKILIEKPKTGSEINVNDYKKRLGSDELISMLEKKKMLVDEETRIEKIHNISSIPIDNYIEKEFDDLSNLLMPNGLEEQNDYKYYIEMHKRHMRMIRRKEERIKELGMRNGSFCLYETRLDRLMFMKKEAEINGRIFDDNLQKELNELTEQVKKRDKCEDGQMNKNKKKLSFLPANHPSHTVRYYSVGKNFANFDFSTLKRNDGGYYDKERTYQITVFSDHIRQTGQIKSGKSNQTGATSLLEKTKVAPYTYDVNGRKKNAYHEKGTAQAGVVIRVLPCYDVIQTLNTTNESDTIGMKEIKVCHRDYPVLRSIKLMEDATIIDVWLRSLRAILYSSFSYSPHPVLYHRTRMNSGLSHLVLSDSLLDRVNVYRYPQSYFLILRRPLSLSSSFLVLLQDIPTEKICEIEWFVYSYGFDDIVFDGRDALSTYHHLISHVMATISLMKIHANAMMSRKKKIVESPKFRIFKLPLIGLDNDEIRLEILSFNKLLDDFIQENTVSLMDIDIKVVEWEDKSISNDSIGRLLQDDTIPPKVCAVHYFVLSAEKNCGLNHTRPYYQRRSDKMFKERRMNEKVRGLSEDTFNTI